MPNIPHLSVNGKSYVVPTDDHRDLLNVLRDDLDLTGTKYGCGEAKCGACMVLIDGQPVPSCITSLGSVRGCAITTIEGVEQAGKLHPVQEAFLQEDALQCGYCTSGMIIGAVALLRQNPAPTEEQIIHGMQRHICRCGTYRRIVRAIQRAAERMAADQ